MYGPMLLELLAGTIIGGGVGFFYGMRLMMDGMRKEAVERGLGRWEEGTGHFKWTGEK